MCVVKAVHRSSDTDPDLYYDWTSPKFKRAERRTPETAQKRLFSIEHGVYVRIDLTGQEVRQIKQCEWLLGLSVSLCDRQSLPVQALYLHNDTE